MSFPFFFSIVFLFLFDSRADSHQKWAWSACDVIAPPIYACDSLLAATNRLLPLSAILNPIDRVVGGKLGVASDSGGNSGHFLPDQRDRETEKPKQEAALRCLWPSVFVCLSVGRCCCCYCCCYCCWQVQCVAWRTSLECQFNSGLIAREGTRNSQVSDHQQIFIIYSSTYLSSSLNFTPKWIWRFFLLTKCM